MTKTMKFRGLKLTPNFQRLCYYSAPGWKSPHSVYIKVVARGFGYLMSSRTCRISLTGPRYDPFFGDVSKRTAENQLSLIARSKIGQTMPIFAQINSESSKIME